MDRLHSPATTMDRCQSVIGLTQRDKQPFTPIGNLESPVNLTPLTVCLWTVVWEEVRVPRQNPHRHGENMPKTAVP